MENESYKGKARAELMTKREYPKKIFAKNLQPKIVLYT